MNVRVSLEVFFFLNLEGAFRASAFLVCCELWHLKHIRLRVETHLAGVYKSVSLFFRPTHLDIKPWCHSFPLAVSHQL